MRDAIENYFSTHGRSADEVNEIVGAGLRRQGASDTEVGELVDDDRDEQPEHPAQAHQPVGARRQPRLVVGEEPLGQRPRHEHGDDQPARVDLDGKPEELEQRDALAEDGPVSSLNEGPG